MDVGDSRILLPHLSGVECVLPLAEHPGRLPHQLARHQRLLQVTDIVNHTLDHLQLAQLAVLRRVGHQVGQLVQVHLHLVRVEAGLADRLQVDGHPLVGLDRLGDHGLHAAADGADTAGGDVTPLTAERLTGSRELSQLSRGAESDGPPTAAAL